MEKTSIDKLKKEKVFEMPEHFPYELPAGVAINQKIYDDIVKYGLFFWKNLLYVTAGKKKTKKFDEFSNEGEEVSWFKSVTNFNIEILQHMEDEKRPMRLVKLINIHKRKRIFECQSNLFTSIGRFKELVEGVGNYQFTGSAVDYEKLKGYLMDRMGDGRMIDVLGWQQEGVFVFNNVAVDDKVHEYTGYGGFEYNDINFYVRSANSIYASNHTKYMNQKRVVYVDSGIKFEQWCKQMVLVHREPAMISIAFAIACVFSDHIFKVHNFFPMIFLYGEAGTGKSKMIEQIQTLFGTPQSPMTITGKANTDKAKIRKFAQFNNMLVFLEEYRNNIDENAVEMLKGLWNRYGYERGNIESDYGTDTVPISSGVVMTGNDYPNNDALLTRLIIVEMMKNTFNDQDKENFSILQDMQADGYSSIILELVQHRKYFVENYLKTYKDIKKEMSVYMMGLNLIDRNIENMSVLATVYALMAKKLKFSFGKSALMEALKEVIRKQNMKRDVGGEVSIYWDIFSQLMKDERQVIHANVDYKIEGDFIFIRYARLHSHYLTKHYLIYKKSGVTKSSMKDKLMKHNSFEADLKHCRIGKGNSTALSFDLNKIDTDSRDSILMNWYHYLPDVDKSNFEMKLKEMNVM